MLLAVIAEVLCAADPDAPDTVTQRAYDEARVGLGHGDTPRADKLVSRFGVGWAVLRDRVLNTDDPARALSIAAKKQTRRVLTTAEAAAALRRAATYLDRNELTTNSYNTAREALNARAAARHTHGQHLIPLPEAEIITRKFKWSDVVKAAGLKMPPTYVPTRLPRDEAICVFIETFGFMPRKEDINWMGREFGVQLFKEMDDQHGPAAQAARERFEGSGRWFPPIKTRGLDRPDNWQQLGDGSVALSELARVCPRQRAMDEGYTIEEVREVLRAAWEVVPRGKRLTVSEYSKLYKANGWPHYFTINKLAKQHDTSFTKLVQEEAGRRAKAV